MGDQHLHITILQLNASQCTIARGLTITQMICDRANQMGACKSPAFQTCSLDPGICNDDMNG